MAYNGMLCPPCESLVFSKGGGCKFITMKNIIFLDIDGVLNCQLHYDSQQFKDYLEKGDKTSDHAHCSSQISFERIGWLNNLCEQTDSQIVVSSTWRSGKSVEQLQAMFNDCGGTFTILDKTGHCECRTRGCEIHEWLVQNCQKHFGVGYYDFYRYAIIDDDSDMLLNQQNHFFQTDTWSGLTPNTCYRIKRFFTHETF
jgi:hypothetical protein